MENEGRINLSNKNGLIVQGKLFESEHRKFSFRFIVLFIVFGLAAQFFNAALGHAIEALFNMIENFWIIILPVSLAASLYFFIKRYASSEDCVLLSGGYIYFITGFKHIKNLEFSYSDLKRAKATSVARFEVRNFLLFKLYRIHVKDKIFNIRSGFLTKTDKAVHAYIHDFDKSAAPFPKEQKIIYPILATIYGVIIILIASIPIFATYTIEKMKVDLDKRQELHGIAEEANLELPLMLNTETRLDFLDVTKGNGIRYNYTLMSQNKYTINNGVKFNFMSQLRTNFCTSVNFEIFRDEDIPVVFAYSDKNGVPLMSFSFSHTDC